MAPSRPDRCETGRARTAEEREQHGFGLVVGGVAGHRVGSERRSTSGACARLEVRAVGDVDVDEPEVGPEPAGDRLGERCVVVGGAAQTVVHVHGRDLTASCDSEGDQRSGIGTARQATRDGGAVRRKGAPGEEVGGVDQRNASVGDR
jgi:hypothetical protein